MAKNHVQVGKKPGYTKGLVVFIDVLGTKNNDFNYLFRINKLFHNELTKREIEIEDVISKKVFSFSDCAYIVYTGPVISNIDYEIFENKNNVISIEDNEWGFYFNVHFCLYDIANILTIFAKNGFLCRGGVAYGDLHFEEKKNILFGPAINEAYLLERVAIMPRIIFADKLIERYSVFDKGLDPIRNRWDFFLTAIQDHYDKRYFLNYLNGMASETFARVVDEKKLKLSNPIIKTRYGFKLTYEKIKKMSDITIQNSTDHKIIAKNIWQLNYLDRINSSYDDYFKNTQMQ